MALDSAVINLRLHLTETSNNVGGSAPINLRLHLVETTNNVGDSPVLLLLNESVQTRTFTAPSNGRFVVQPVRGLSGPTNGRVALGVPPGQHHGGATEGEASFIPLNSYGFTTGGEIGFAGVPPAAFLIAVPVASGQILLAWTDVSNKESGFRIERSLNGHGAWSTIGTVPADTVTFLDTTATPLVVFDYRVVAFNKNEEAAPSNVASAYSPAPGVAPPPPSPQVLPRVLEFLSPGVYGVERDPDGTIGGAKP